MEKIFEDKFQIINYYPEKTILECIWQNTEEMVDEDYQQGLQKQVELVEKYKITKELFDTHSFQYTISVDMQEWTDKEIYTKLHKLGVRQFALIVPHEFIAQLSLEQTTEEGKANVFDPKFFATRKEAQDFLLSLPY